MTEYKTAYNLGTYYRTDGKTFQKKLDHRFYDGVSLQEFLDTIAEKSKTVLEISIEPGIIQEEWADIEPFVRITGWETELSDYHQKAARMLDYT